MPQNSWTRDELIVAFNLYCKTPFTRIGASNKGIKELAPIIGRSVSAVALKLANFARLDPSLSIQNIKGMRHGSKAEVEIWNEFNNNWEELAWQSELILARFKNSTVENSSRIHLANLPTEGIEREALVRVRVNQSFFRKTILASYNNQCCITGISQPELLVASHIIPWSVNSETRMNPANGICLNTLHDKAFDLGLLTITEDFKILLSTELLNSKNSEQLKFFIPYSDRKITMPQKFYPDPSFLQYHNTHIFKG
jgi:putative restriction endonuclease